MLGIGRFHRFIIIFLHTFLDRHDRTDNEPTLSTSQGRDQHYGKQVTPGEHETIVTLSNKTRLPCILCPRSWMPGFSARTRKSQVPQFRMEHKIGTLSENINMQSQI